MSNTLINNDERIKADKQIVIDGGAINESTILESDAYVERGAGEQLAPSQFSQKVVDADTARKMAAQKGIQLAPTVDAAIGNSNIPTQVNQTGKGVLPDAIMESFRKQPPLAPTPEMTSPQINEDALVKIKEYNERLNKVTGEGTSRIPKTAHQPMINEQVSIPEPMINTQLPYYNAPQQSGGSIDYSIIAAIIKESVREVLKDVNIKDMVKEVLTEERDKIQETKINENIEIRIGTTVLRGKVLKTERPKK